jgi:diacylglycerol kinase (ATP)
MRTSVEASSRTRVPGHLNNTPLIEKTQVFDHRVPQIIVPRTKPKNSILVRAGSGERLTMHPELATFNTTLHQQHELPPTRTHIVVNPSSSGGKTEHRQEQILHELHARLTGDITAFVTTGPLEATTSTRTAIREGAELIVVVGGDGTIHEAVNGFFDGDRQINPACRLGIVSSGTAQDSARGFAIPRGTLRQIEAVCGPGTHRVDCGRLRCVDDRGRAHHEYFLNECQQGIAAVVVQRFQSHHKWMGGFLGFGITAIATAARHREQVMTVEIDGRHIVTEPLLGVVAANGAFAGGGMHFAPRSKVDDGLLDIVIIHKRSIPSRLVSFPRIYFGTHVNLSWISYIQGRSVKVTSDEKVPVEADGEFQGSVPCEIDLLPSAITLKR